jgi:hypothetical protein
MLNRLDRAAWIPACAGMTVAIPICLNNTTAYRQYFKQNPAI